MDGLTIALALLVGLGLGGAAGAYLGRARAAAAIQRLAQAENEADRLKQELARAEAALAEGEGLATELKVEAAKVKTELELQRQASAEKLALLDQARTTLSETFKALSAEALRSNNQSFLELARTSLERFQAQAKGELELKKEAVDGLIKPIKTSLEQVNAQISELEKSRREAYGSLTAQVRSLTLTQDKLQSETANLVKALRKPQVRGRWGEIQLKRVVELAGMTPYCDFVEQHSLTTEEGRLRPDMIVRLPGGKNVVVDAKAPLQAYLDAVEAEDEADRTRHLVSHTRQIKDHVAKLSSKQYWSQFDSAPDFVIMFLPGENFYNAALEQEPQLLEEIFKEGVILATPTTLIALLKAAAYGWNQERIAANAQQISRLGRELYDRLAVLTRHFDSLGRGLGAAVEFYNKAVGSLESRVLASARRFTELGVGSDKDLDQARLVDQTTRSLQSPELVGPRNGEEPEG